MKNTNNKTRLYVLIALTILSAIFLVLTTIPNSPFIGTNDCMNTEQATKMYASKDLKARAKYIENRNKQCKELLQYAQEPKDTYEQLDSCTMVDSVLDASRHYMDYHKKDKTLVNEELRFLRTHIKKYNYCPQYEDVVKELTSK